MQPDQDRARRAYEDMVRRLAELDRVDGIDLTPRRPPPLRQPRRRRLQREHRPRTGTTAAIAVLLIAAVLFSTGWWRELLDFSPTTTTAASGSGQWPPLPEDAQPDRLLSVVAPGLTGAHAFQELRPDGKPVGYDPCRPIRYVINPARSGDGGLTMVREAVREISAATGLVFIEEEVSDEMPVSDRSPVQTDRYGNRWAPLLVGWATENELDTLGGDVAGFGGSHLLAPGGPGTERFVSGEIVLDAEYFDELPGRPDGFNEGRSIVMHELGHVLGLLHVTDPNELMHESGNGSGVLGPGDRQGLAAVGAGPCFTDT